VSFAERAEFSLTAENCKVGEDSADPKLTFHICHPKSTPGLYSGIMSSDAGMFPKPRGRWISAPEIWLAREGGAYWTRT